jgi:hypothetical protein
MAELLHALLEPPHNVPCFARLFVIQRTTAINCCAMGLSILPFNQNYLSEHPTAEIPVSAAPRLPNARHSPLWVNRVVRQRSGHFRSPAITGHSPRHWLVSNVPSKADLSVGLRTFAFALVRTLTIVRRSSPSGRAGLNKAKGPRKLRRMLMIVTVFAALGRPSSTLGGLRCAQTH